MAKQTIGFGVILIVLGLGAYFGTQAITSMIPAFFGLPLVILGVLAFKEAAQMHVMHGAALLGLLGFIAPMSRLIPAFLSTEKKSTATAMGVQLAMAVICIVFLGLCIRSFVHARRQRATEAQ